MNWSRRRLWALYFLQTFLGAWATRSLSVIVVGVVVAGLELFSLCRKGLVSNHSSNDGLHASFPGAGGVSRHALRVLASVGATGGTTRILVSSIVALVTGVLVFLWKLRVSDSEAAWVHRIFGSLIPALMFYEGILIVILTKHSRCWLRPDLRRASGRWLIPLVVATVVMSIAITQYRGAETILVAVSVCSVMGIAAFNDAIQHQLRLCVDVPANESTGMDPRFWAMPTRQSVKPRPTVLIFTFFITAAWTTSFYLENSLPVLQGWMDSTIVNSSTSFSNSNLGLNYRYVNAASLTSVSDQILESPQQIAFRAYCPVAPGYLRGRVFETYRNGRWSPTPVGSVGSGTRDLRPTAIEAIPERDGIALNHFQIAPTTIGRRRTIEIENDPTRGSFFFTPLGMEAMEGSGTRLRLDRNGIPRSGIRAQFPYRAIIGESSAAKMNADLDLDNYLDIPAQIAESIRQIGQELCAGRLATSEKVKVIESFLRNRFEYSMERTLAPATDDPILYFLKSKHPAHCEYFATAAALLLRSVDVPSRYVTGYVTTELADNEEYWLARNRNAHAWVEAYIAEDERWVIVEPTPGRSIVEIEFDTDSEDGNKAIHSIQGNRRETSFMLNFYRWLSDWGQEAKLRVVGNTLSVLLLLFAAVMLWVRWYPAIAGRLSGASSLLPHELELRVIDRVAAKLGYVRCGSETIHQFARRLEKLGETEQPDAKAALEELAGRYRDYASSRYGGSEMKQVK